MAADGSARGVCRRSETDETGRISQHPLRAFGDMAVMGEDDDLGVRTHFAQQAQAGLRAFLIKAHEQVIGQEGQGGGAAGMLLDGRHPQGEEQLVGRPLGEPSKPTSRPSRAAARRGYRHHNPPQYPPSAHW